MKTKHTPAPWFFTGDCITSVNRGKRYRTVGVPGDAGFRCVMSQVDHANGYLMAAAPELLEALKEAVDLFEPHVCEGDDTVGGVWLTAARDAIAKAEARWPRSEAE